MKRVFCSDVAVEMGVQNALESRGVSVLDNCKID